MELFVAINSFFLLLALAVNLGLAIFVFLKNPQEETNRFFSYLMGATSLWILSFLLFLNVNSVEWVLLLRRLTPVGSALIAGVLLYFSLVFPSSKKTYSFWIKLICLLPGFLFSFISIFTAWMVRGYYVTDVNYLFLGRPLFGWAYQFYSLYFIIYFFLGLGILIRKYILAKDRAKLQIFYLLFGVSVAGICGVVASLLLPLLGMPRLFTVGPPFTLIMAYFATHAMVRYKLLNIEDFVRHGILFLFATAAAVGTFAVILIGQWTFLFSFYVVLANLMLGLLVLFQHPRNKINLSFFLITIGIVLWTIGVHIFWNSANLGLVFFGGKLAFLGAAGIPSFLLLFSLAFPKQLKPISRYHWSLIVFPLMLFPSLIFSNLILKEVASLAGGVQRIYGAAYPLFSLYYLFYLGLFFYNLFIKERALTGISRIQVRYVFLAFGLACSIAVTTNLILPLFGLGTFSFIGPHATIILVGVLAYAILKHRLMSVEVVIQRSTVYGTATLLIMALYALAVIVSETFFRKMMGYSSLVITAAAALLIAVVYQPLVKSFQNLTDRLFFRGRYDYQETLREISHKIAAVIQLEELSKLIVSSFIDTMKVSEISFLLLDKDHEHFCSTAISLPRYKKIEIDVSSPIISWLSASKDILVRDEIEDEISHQEVGGEGGKLRQHSLQEVGDEMDRLGISVWVPIVSKDSLIGIIALGNKLSGDVFTTEDLGLLSTLASQTAVALDNARLYDEVVNMKEYSEKILQSMVSGVLTVDTKGRVVTYNSMAEQITGRKKLEVLGKACEDIWGKRGMISNIIENTLSKAKSYVNFESNLASPEKGLVPVAFSSTLLFDHAGKKLGALITIQDLSEVKELEDKVRQADKLGALATMAAGMAHEIKNPLSSMKVLSQLLPKKIDDPDYRKKLGEIIPREINRIDKIVESLLGFARATTLSFEPTDITEILEENLKYFEAQAADSDVKIIRDYAKLPLIEVDRSQISQVFSNLILNALQSMSGGGELKVVTKLGKAVEGITQNIKIQVTDSGYGIAEEKLKKLF
ncbi:MAG: PAS domain S-box protein, partial [Candidatus Margulisbacteria bacterium]|nr:PAS domain S-box protein [Candidatus Margulisiibacteriota bacterium]